MRPKVRLFEQPSGADGNRIAVFYDQVGPHASGRARLYIQTDTFMSHDRDPAEYLSAGDWTILVLPIVDKLEQ